MSHSDEINLCRPHLADANGAITSQQLKVDGVLEPPAQIARFLSEQPEPKAQVAKDDGAAAGADDSLINDLLAMDGVSSVTLGDDYKSESGDLFYNVLTDTPAAEAEVAHTLENRFASDKKVEVLSLIEEAKRDESSRAGLRLFADVFAGVLACIGIADVFSNVLGRIPERRREISQLLAAGITRKQVRRMFTREAILIVARPLAWAAALNLLITVFAVEASPVTWEAFLAHMPIVHVAVFAAI